MSASVLVRPRLFRYLAALGAAILISGCAAASSQEGPVSEGRTVYGATCSACHGSGGGGGVGPALRDVGETFPSCTDQIQWITLGSEKWKTEIGSSYGATNKPIDKVMPEFGAQLTPREIAAVAAFERTTYGGLDRGTVESDCGFSPGGEFEAP
jgi:mono/diheme cytochrome c family protein